MSPSAIADAQALGCTPVPLYAILFAKAMSIVPLSVRSRFSLQTRLAASPALNPTGRGSSSRLSRVLSVVLVLAIMGTIGAIVYLAITPHIGEKFTEFYILGLQGKAEDYPTDIVLGEEARVILGIVNQEYEEVSYRVEVRIDKATNKKIGPVVLPHEQKWEQAISFTPTKVGEDQKVEFVLYKHGQEEPCLTLRLWINVKEE